jgi:hypothetical protein
MGLLIMQFSSMSQERKGLFIIPELEFRNDIFNLTVSLYHKLDKL